MWLETVWPVTQLNINSDLIIASMQVTHAHARTCRQLINTWVTRRDTRSSEESEGSRTKSSLFLIDLWPFFLSRPGLFLTDSHDLVGRLETGQLALMRLKSYDWLRARHVTQFLFFTCFSVSVRIHGKAVMSNSRPTDLMIRHRLVSSFYVHLATSGIFKTNLVLSSLVRRRPKQYPPRTPKSQQVFREAGGQAGKQRRALLLLLSRPHIMAVEGEDAAINSSGQLEGPPRDGSTSRGTSHTPVIPPPARIRPALSPRGARPGHFFPIQFEYKLETVDSLRLTSKQNTHQSIYLEGEDLLMNYVFLNFASRSTKFVAIIVIFVAPANVSQHYLLSTSKSNTSSFVSSVPLRLPTAHTSFVSLARMRQTTPPLPPLSNATKLRINSPAGTNQYRLLQTKKTPSNCYKTNSTSLNMEKSPHWSTHMQTLEVKYLPESVCRHCPVTMSQTLTVESALPDTRMLFRSSMPEVRLWWPMRRVDPVGVTLQRVEALFPFSVPHFYHVIVGTTDNQPPIILDATYSCQMAHKNVQTLSALNVPHAQRRIPGSAHNPDDARYASY
uniref:Uncharacterized protein n=1 Tax=Timema poppense TaxID=170557 RepID=A0A7R9GYC8_TIMPO|nr:unnamed protein product [Timema poppensis]